MTDIYIKAEGSSPGLGTFEAPFVAPSRERFEYLMREHGQRGNHVHLAGGHYLVGPTHQWNRQPGRGFTFNGQVTLEPDAVVELDVAAFTMDDLVSEPLHMFIGQGVWDDPDRSFEEFQTLSGVEVFNALPRGQAFRGGTLILNHSKLQPMFLAAGHSCMLGAVLLNGQNKAIEGTKLLDYGAYRYNPKIGAESFPFVCSVATSGFDQNKLAELGPGYVADLDGVPSHISGTTADGYVPEFSNDQVTVRMINGSFGELGGFGTKQWRYLWHAYCYQEGNVTIASGKNQVQGHTNYLANAGHVWKNKTDGADVLYYADYLQSKGQVIEENEASGARHIVNLLLSPATGNPELGKDFSHEGYTIGLNKGETTGNQVSIRKLDKEWLDDGNLVVPDTRFIRNIKVHASLSLDSDVPVECFGVDLNKRKGCLSRFGIHKG